MRRHVGMLWVVLASLGLGACTRSPEANAKPEPAPSAATAASTTATSLFCAYGGVGVVPDPLPPGYETVFGVHAFELENSGPAAADGITVLGASLLDDAGNTRRFAPPGRSLRYPAATPEPRTNTWDLRRLPQP